MALFFTFSAEIKSLDFDESLENYIQDMPRLAKETGRFTISYLVAYLVKNLASLQLHKSQKWDNQLFTYTSSLIGLYASGYLLSGIDENSHYEKSKKVAIIAFAQALALFTPPVLKK